MVLSNQKPQIQFLDLLTGSTSLSTKIQSISLVHQTQLTIASPHLVFLHKSTIYQLLLVSIHLVITLHVLLKPPAVTPQVPQYHVVAKIIMVILLPVQQLAWTTITIQLLALLLVGIKLEMLFLVFLTAQILTIIPLTATFKMFKIKTKLKIKHNHHHLKCSAINLIHAITQVIQSGVNLTNPINLLDKTKFNLEHHKPSSLAQLIT